MSYEKTSWSASTPLTVSNLSHIEDQHPEIMTDLEAHDDAGHPSLYRTKSEMNSYFWSAGNDGSGSGLNADTLEGVHAAAISGGVPSGFMGWWNPENGAVPSGFLFCDGSNGTLDMRNRFPIGASETVGATGGNANITPEGNITIAPTTLTVANIHHVHTMLDQAQGRLNAWLWSGSGFPVGNTEFPSVTASVGGGGSHDHPGTFTGDLIDISPLFRYLVIIQKS